MIRLFVYGTLRAGQSNHYLLRQATKLGACQLTSGYLLYDLGHYPGARQSPSSHIPLIGEVYEVDSTTFAALDLLEEYPEVYTRELIDTEYGVAWIYLYCLSVAGFPLISNGDWCQWRGL